VGWGTGRGRVCLYIRRIINPILLKTLVVTKFSRSGWHRYSLNWMTMTVMVLVVKVHQEAIHAASTATPTTKAASPIVQHPDTVELLHDQAVCMRYYESSRALLGDEGTEIAAVIRAIERNHLRKQLDAWKRKHKSLWAKPDLLPVVRVHPAATLLHILTDARMVIVFGDINCDP
jgi:hypothetical protein